MGQALILPSISIVSLRRLQRALDSFSRSSNTESLLYSIYSTDIAVPRGSGIISIEAPGDVGGGTSWELAFWPDFVVIQSWELGRTTLS